MDQVHTFQPELHQAATVEIGALHMLGRKMQTWYVEFSARMPADLDHTGFEEHVEEVLVELDKLDGITDADVLINYSEPRVMFSMYVQAKDDAQALSHVASSMRTAIHAAGGSTPGWEKLAEKMASSTRYELYREDALT